MEVSNTQCPFQCQFVRFSQELKDVLAAMREAESALQFELATQDLARIILEMECLGGGSGA